MELDMNIDNYNLEDLLNLFKITCDFDKEDLKICKKKVLMMHPDKSSLPEEYFIFFMKAYEMIENIYKYKTNELISSNESDILLPEASEEIKTFINKNNFNKLFNELFDTHKITTEHEINGYQDYLSSDLDDNVKLLNDPSLNIKQKQQILEQIRNKNRKDQLVIHKDVQETIYSDNSLSTIDGSVPIEFTSDLFSKLQYGDIQSVHENSLISVTEEDMRKQQFNSLEDLQKFRTHISAPMNEIDASLYLRDINSVQNQTDTRRAFKLIQQQNMAQQHQDQIHSHFRLLRS